MKMHSSATKNVFCLFLFFLVVLTVDSLFVSAGNMGPGKKSISSVKKSPPWNKFGAFVKSKLAKSKREMSNSDSSESNESEELTARELNKLILNMVEESDLSDLQDQKKEEELPRFDKKESSEISLNEDKKDELPRFDKRESNEIKKELPRFDKRESDSIKLEEVKKEAIDKDEEKSWRELIGWLVSSEKNNEVTQDEKKELPMSFIGKRRLDDAKKSLA
ncbi:nucleolar protein 58 isoform X2 [Hydra vulgaris]|uniref:nucleolar protein 58 isoform X2 n=1 Tax=Hydra vulgaris TaxID=6087 RepID=UPI0006416F88|nr:nucleolar protein 58 isoform X1 [Hydra vulgaris]